MTETVPFDLYLDPDQLVNHRIGSGSQSLAGFLFNLMALRAVGPLAEKFLGSAKFLTIYLLAGLAGSAVSGYWNAPYGLGVGASGAVFGVIGVATVIGYRIGNRDLSYAMLRWIVIILVIGFAMPRIDNAAHLGGLGFKL